MTLEEALDEPFFISLIASAAIGAAAQSAASANRAQAWAESPTPPDPDDATSKSSKTWAGEAAASAALADSEGNATIALNAAQSAEQDADRAEAARDAAQSAALAAAEGLSDDDKLQLWTATEAFVLVSATFSGAVLASGNVVWPDGSSGVLTVTASSPSRGWVNAFNVTHVDFARRATQPAVTRDNLGRVVTRPAITVGAI